MEKRREEGASPRSQAGETTGMAPPRIVSKVGVCVQTPFSFHFISFCLLWLQNT